MAARPPDPIYSLRGSVCDLTSIAFLNPSDRESQLVASGASDGQVTIWSLTSRRPVCGITAHEKSVLAVEFVARNKVISQGRDGYIRIWQLDGTDGGCRETSRMLNEIHVAAIGFCRFHYLEISGLADYAGRQALLAFAGENKSLINVVAMATDTFRVSSPVAELTTENAGNIGMCMAVCLIRLHGRLFVVGGFECGEILVWDLDAKDLTSRVKLHQEPLTCFCLDSTCTRGMSGAAEMTCQIFEFKLNESKLVSNCVQSVKLPVTSKAVSDIAIRSDDKIVAVGCWDGTIRVFGWKKVKLLAVLMYHSQGISSVSFSKSCVSEQAMLLAAASRDKRISIWSLYN